MFRNLRVKVSVGKEEKKKRKRKRRKKEKKKEKEKKGKKRKKERKKRKGHKNWHTFLAVPFTLLSIILRETKSYQGDKVKKEQA